MTSSIFSRSSPNSIPPQYFLEVPELFRSQRLSIFWPSRFPCHETLFPVVKILKPRSVRLLLRAVESSSTNLGRASSLGDDVEEEDGLCPVDCVKEFKTEEEFSRILEKAKGTNSLVVVDFYRTSCGSCKYIEQGFVKLCKRSGDDKDSVVFLKHNVLDEYDEQSEVAERLRIKTVPLFQFYKDGVLLEAFATRDKERIVGVIRKYISAD
ncbi:thioredoxin-like 4, chloroplastic [Phalaenopsis equestris]|uniref:thioredoxin-like 4, chloroplastic n=1 Tax=Phalaenopsis equestris TaxID=78828 RepID=UPI0009E471BE|nr:thioredoxin-like 4, chloroplastic [Phalaenopsis equestris]